MAEEIKLVGVFKDDITPKLKKLNTSINQVTKSFAKMGKKLRPIAREFGKLAASVDRVGEGMARQNAELKMASVTMSKYRTQVRRTAAEQRKLKPMRGGAGRGAGGGAGGGRAPRGGGGGGLGGVGAGFLAAGATVGSQFGAMVMQGMSRAFDMYKNVLLKPFQFLASGIQERIDDEMDDIKTAGGLFSISKRSENPFIQNFSQAEALTKETNRYLAELAGALPGDTQQYIQVSRQISDGIYQILSNDKEGSLNLAKKIADQNGRVLEYGGQTDAKQIQMAGKELVGEMTKLTVLGSLGQKQGAMGLPQLIEQMMSQDQVSSGQFRRYAAIFRDPLVKGALERNIPKINQAGKNTADRLEALQETLNEVVTPELVRRYQRSTAGVIEEMKTLFLNPEVGMLGLGRPLKLMAQSFDSFGNAIMKDGQAVTEAISVFDYVRDIFANLAIVLGPVIKVATDLFMGFEDLAKELDGIRNFTMALQSSFENYRKGFEELGSMLTGDSKTLFNASIPIRSALAALNNMFLQLGIIDKDGFMANAGKLSTSYFTDFAGLVSEMLSQFLGSEAAIKFGREIGEVFGTVLSSFTDLIMGVTGNETENIFTGFMEGFRGKGGVKAAKDILNLFVSAIGKILLMLVKAAPAEMAMLVGIALIPALMSGLVAAIPSLISILLPVIGTGLKTLFVKLIIGLASGAGAAIAGALAAVLGVGVLASIFYEPIMGFINRLSSSLKGMLPEYTHGLINGITSIFKGIVNVFAGIGDIVIGIVTLDGRRIVEGITKLFGGIIQVIVGAAQTAIGFQTMIVGAVRSLFDGIVNAIKNAASAVGDFLTPDGQTGGNRRGQGGGRSRSSSSYAGNTSRTMSLGSAIGSEMKNKPAGSHLVIANSSETVIPAAGGYSPNGSMGGGGGHTFNINVSGGGSAQETAEIVAQQIVYAIQKSTYNELYTS